MGNGTGWQEKYLNEEGERGEGFTEKQEEQFFDKIAEQIREVVSHFSKDNGRGMRANHAKIVAGFTDAEFRVAPDIPADLAVGFLREPGRVYKAIVRFSNASGDATGSDAKPDLRGVGLRVLTDEGDHDFLMTNAEQHHAVDAREAMVAIIASTKKDDAEDLIPGETFLDKLAGLVALKHLKEKLGRETGQRIADTLKGQVAREVRSLATESYFSRAPLAVGEVSDPRRSVAVKYRLASAEKDEAGDPQNLARELGTRLGGGEVKFHFQVQRFVNETVTPIEDATKIWSEASPFAETIAELVIPRGAKPRDEEVDRIVFDPWRVNSAHFRPLGSMNRSRRKVYAASVAERAK